MIPNICKCCKTNYVGETTVMCDNCWDWHMNKLTMMDLTVIIASIHHREPDNKYAQEICEYLVADNYMQGKAKLGK